MKIGRLENICTIDFSQYNTCRGAADKAEFERIVGILLDENANEDDMDEAINDGLWDLFSHQYTLYSATPLALYLILSKSTIEQRKRLTEVNSFIELCSTRGNEGIYLTEREVTANQAGNLPIFSIPDIIASFS